ncbi:hypothetical protein B296_00010696 [Ensete ventricosum]|uniref:Uncharacterized protein n=1 Tax=Ensete ventricosum TaxID=4639 RepID=A0A427B778_ENSVE|nr:hypothetical protein B296_00010696 [Ensete ventricosum]
MIMSYWELHFGVQHNDKKAMDSRSECHGTAEAGLPCVHRILHWMKALVISIWGLYTTEGEFQVQVSVSPIGGLNHTKNGIDMSPAIGWQRSCMRVVVCLSIDKGELLGEHKGVEAGSRKGRGSGDKSSYPKAKCRSERW